MALMFIKRKPRSRRGGDFPGSHADQRHHASCQLYSSPAGLQILYWGWKEMRPGEFTVYLGGRKYDSLKNSLSKQEASRRLCNITWYWTSLVAQWFRISPPAIAGDTGLIPGLGRFCMLGSNKSCVPQLQSPALEPMLYSKRSRHSEKLAHHSEE